MKLSSIILGLLLSVAIVSCAKKTDAPAGKDSASMATSTPVKTDSVAMTTPPPKTDSTAMLLPTKPDSAGKMSPASTPGKMTAASRKADSAAAAAPKPSGNEPEVYNPNSGAPPETKKHGK